MLTNFRRGLMGTLEFDALFPGMRKAQDFITYPIKTGETPREIHVQSDTRFGAIDLQTGQVRMSKPHPGGSNAVRLALTGSVIATLNGEQLLTLKAQLAATSNAKAGRSGVITTDNGGAIGVLS